MRLKFMPGIGWGRYTIVQPDEWKAMVAIIGILTISR